MTKNTQIISFTAGKGGVGKSSAAINTAIELARLNQSVMVLDADLGLANVNVMLGLHAKKNISHLLEGLCSLDEIILDGPCGVKIIPAASGLKNMTNLSTEVHQLILAEFKKYDDKIDTLIIDTAAGISDDVVDFVTSANEIIIVLCDEPSSITDAYAMMKILNRDHGKRRFNILTNMTSSDHDSRLLFNKFTTVCQRFLDIQMQYLGSIPYDEHLRASAKARRAVCELYPDSDASLAFKQIARRLKAKKTRDKNVSQGGLSAFAARFANIRKNIEKQRSLEKN